jgi:hypothetical protein
MDIRLRALLLIFAIIPLSLSARFKFVYADPLICLVAALLFALGMWNFSINLSRKPELRDTVAIYENVHKEKQVIRRLLHPKYHYKFWLYGAFLGLAIFGNLTAVYNIWFALPLRYGLGAFAWGATSVVCIFFFCVAELTYYGREFFAGMYE